MATLTVTHSESLVLDGRDRSATSTFTITNIDNIYERTLSVANTATTIALFRDEESGADGAIDIQEAKYIRITNTDTADILILAFDIDQDEDDGDAGETFNISVSPGQSFVFGSPHDSANANDSDVGGESIGIDAALHDIRKIIGKNGTDSTNLKVEIYIAGTEA
jgi:hypothetical protein